MGKKQKVLEINSLAIKDSTLSKELHPTKNNNITAYDISYY